MLIRSKVRVAAVGANGSATGYALTVDKISGWVVSIYAKMPAGAPATTDIVVIENSVPNPKTVISKANFTASQWINPVEPTHNAADAVATGQTRPMIVSDVLRFTVSQANSGQVFDFEVFWDNLE